MHSSGVSSELQASSGRYGLWASVHDLAGEGNLSKTGSEETDAQWASDCPEVSPWLQATSMVHIVPFFRHDQSGHFMVSASAEGPVFFYNSKPSTNFEVLGYLGMLNLLQECLQWVWLVTIIRGYGIFLTTKQLCPHCKCSAQKNSRILQQHKNMLRLFKSRAGDASFFFMLHDTSSLLPEEEGY